MTAIKQSEFIVLFLISLILTTAIFVWKKHRALDPLAPFTSAEATRARRATTLDLLESLYKSIENRNTIKKQSELPIPIKELIIYPFRGIPGMKVEEVYLGDCGILNDRIFCIVDSETLFP
jgi:hypothetical protein